MGASSAQRERSPQPMSRQLAKGGINLANEALGNDTGAGSGLELCSGSIQEDCISARPQVNQCEEDPGLYLH